MAPLQLERKNVISKGKKKKIYIKLDFLESKSLKSFLTLLLSKLKKNNLDQSKKSSFYLNFQSQSTFSQTYNLTEVNSLLDTEV